VWNPGSRPAPASERPRAGVRQVCATLLALLGLPPRAGAIEGPLPGVVANALAPVDYAAEFAGGRAPARDQLDSGQATSGAPGETAPPDDDALMKLRALGYVGSAEPERAAGAASGSPGSEPGRTAGSFNNEGLILLSGGRPAEAAAAFESALRVDPRNGSALANLS